MGATFLPPQVDTLTEGQGLAPLNSVTPLHLLPSYATVLQQVPGLSNPAPTFPKGSAHQIIMEHSMSQY